MKKPLIMLTSAILIALYADAQSLDSALVTVHYNFSQITDTTRRDAPDLDDMVLFLGRRSSLFTSNTCLQADIRIADLYKKYPGMVIRMTNNYGMPYAVYADMSTKKITNVALFQGVNYAIVESVPAQNWKITNETKDIQGHSCQKATTFFRGRNYEAWFCSELPYHSGPWKMSGLPGLIMEAYDTKKEVVFTFKSFEENSPRTVITLPSPVIQTTIKELKKAVDAVLNDQAGKESGGMKMAQVSANGSTGPAKRKEYNNPIEKDSGK